MTRIIGVAMNLIYVTVGIVLGYFAFQYSLEYIGQKRPQDKEFITAAERERQLKCLALNVYHEAGVESFEGKVAVAQVTLNRADSGKFPADICAVIYQKNTFLAKTVCQFSWYCIQPSKLSPTNTKSYDESYTAAKRVLLENFRLESIQTALFYHADYVNPGWKYKRVAKIGKHIFYE
jgi:spore germination cell wall hydrolase CwlJ-like protein